MVENALSPQAPQAAQKTRPPELPKLLTPRQTSLRAVGMVFGAEIVIGVLWALSQSAWLALGLFVGAAMLWGRQRRGNLQAAMTANERAREFLDLGALDDAEAVLDEVLASRRTPPSIRCFAAYYRALTSLRRGDYADARARLHGVLDSQWVNNGRTLQGIAPGVYASMALAATLDGDLEDAERWRELGRRSPASLERHWFVSDAYVLARRQRWTELLEFLERHQDAIEGTVSGVGIRQLQLLKAFALTQLQEREDNYRGLHSGEDIHAMLHGTRRGRFDHIAKRWPELRAFMAAHHLLAEPFDETSGDPLALDSAG
ncbi:hypothetical protein G6O69_19280 [Pseudenhygromyxa sp. WMMC2535]|uniref:tetratricopeptide repeat protein n=1 Tax=Pseudenhygromyxa sp. WMMC2535 TaxID=2712867 RepID=UPI001554521A|nr:hypothetical protein [Pseudenhygromyxa sp. WMMC2535]NVB39996.1 hypothetical protein [Pseudenhygromyxa sp. WMMC2535]